MDTSLLKDVEAIDVQLDDHARRQSIAAGFANVQEYVNSLLSKDRDRIAIRKGYEDVQAGRTRPFSEFDAEMRQKLGMSISG